MKEKEIENGRKRVKGDEETKKEWARVLEHLATPRVKDHSFHISIHLTSLSRVLVQHTRNGTQHRTAQRTKLRLFTEREIIIKEGKSIPGLRSFGSLLLGSTFPCKPLPLSPSLERFVAFSWFDGSAVCAVKVIGNGDVSPPFFFFGKKSTTHAHTYIFFRSI